MIWIGLIIVIVTLYAIIKNYEARVVLIVSGFLMAVIGGQPMAAYTAFIKEFTNPGMVPIICTVMGFSYVMDYTGCSKHLVRFMTGTLGRTKLFLIPLAVLITWILNTAIMSAAGIAAAVGAILVPTLIASRVHPAMAASAIMLGTWGSAISPGNVFMAQVADLAKTDLMMAIGQNADAYIIGSLVAAITLTIIAFVKKEAAGSQEIKENLEAVDDEFKINYIYALIPILPIILLILGSKQVGWIPYIDVPQAMVFVSILSLLVTRVNYIEFTKKFFKGNGDAFSEIIGLLAAAAVFINGMQVIGLTGALIDAMKNSDAIAKVASAFGPFIIAAVSGSGVAATLAFNGSVTPHAAQFGLSIVDVGSMAQAAGQIGRAMSPVAGATIILAKFAGVNPIEIAKRNALPTILATIVMMLIIF